MVPQILLNGFATGFGAHVVRETHRPFHAVVHGGKPFIVSLHPSEVIVGRVLIAKIFGVSLAAVESCRWDADVCHKGVLAGVAVGEQPREMGRVIVFGLRAVEVAEGVDFVGEHVADARGGAARAAVLIEHRREESRQTVVDMVRTCFAGAYRGGAQTGVRLAYGLIVGVLFHVHLMLRPSRGRKEDTSRQKNFV